MIPMIDKQFQSSIAATMIGPLFARAYYGRLYPEILKDPEAEELISQVRTQYPDAANEFRALDEIVDEFVGLALLIRAKTFDDMTREYLINHPHATIVSLGCGLDTCFSRLDNGTLSWYDLDLPESINYRLTLIPETTRSHCIPKSIFDRSWFQDISISPERGLLFIAGGLFGYFQEKDIYQLLIDMIDFFGKADLLFDIYSKLGNRILNRRLAKAGVKGVRFLFALDNPRPQLKAWSERIRIKESFSMFSRISRNPRWSRKTRLYMKLVDYFSIASFIHVSF